MAEALIRVVDRSGAPIDSKAGDVISVCPDGWAWSSAERTNPAWRIVSVIGILQSTVDALLAPDVNAVTSQMTRRRAW